MTGFRGDDEGAEGLDPHDRPADSEDAADPNDPLAADEAPLPPDDPRNAFLNEKAMSAIAFDYLVRRCRAQEADAKDAVQVTLFRAWRKWDRFPTERDAYLVYFLRTAKNAYLDHMKAEKREHEGRLATQDLRTSYVPPRFTVKEILQALKVMVKGKTDEETLAILYEAIEEDFKEIAAGRGISHWTAYKRREGFQAKYAALWAAALILLGLAGWRVATTPHHDAPIVRDDYPPPPPKPTATPEERAAAMRDEALKNCDVVHEEECAGKLNEAVQLSPAIADDPHVRELLLRFAYTIPGWDAGGPHDESKRLKRR